MNKVVLIIVKLLKKIIPKNLINIRNKWIKSGEDTLITNTNFDKLKKKINSEEIQVKVKKITKKDDYKVILLSGLYDEALPAFRAGNKIALRMTIDERYYTNTYSLVNAPSRAIYSEYKIVVTDDDYLSDKLEQGDKLVISKPFGDFYYNKIKDEKDVIAIVDDRGILSIMAMLQSIVDGSECIRITLFYVVKKFKDILLYDELYKINNKYENVDIKFILSKEKKKGFLSGTINSNMIKKEMHCNNCSFFLSGSEVFLKYLNKELGKLKISKKYINYEKYVAQYNPSKVIEYKLTLYINNGKYELKCYNNKTIIQAIYDSGVYIPSKCNVGSCGFCKSELVSGKVKILSDSSVDKTNLYIHPCITYPLSDIKIIVR